MPRRSYNWRRATITVATPRAGDGATATILPRPARPIITIPAGRTPMATAIAAVCLITSGAGSSGAAFGGGEHARDGRDEMGTRFRHGKSTRRKGVPIEKKAGHCKRAGEIGGGRRRRVVTQEGRQRQELVAVRIAASARDGTAGARRHIDQVGRCPGGGAGTEIKTETKLGEEGELEPRYRRRADRGIAEALGT